MINNVQLIGRLGKDPEEMKSGVKLTLATTEVYKDEKGEKIETTEWHNIVVFGKMAAVVLQYSHKGQLLYVEGKIKTSMFEKNGEKRYSTSIVSNKIQFLSKQNNSDTGHNNSGGNLPSEKQNNPAMNTYLQSQGNIADDDSELPF